MEPSDELEDDMLDKAWGLEPDSRLSCQAVVADEDLVVEIPKYTINQVSEGTEPGGREERAMSLKWTDVLEIAIQLDESKPEVDPRYVNFVDLRRWVVELPEFSDDPQRSGEKVLEAIQAAWIEERD